MLHIEYIQFKLVQMQLSIDDILNLIQMLIIANTKKNNVNDCRLMSCFFYVYFAKYLMFEDTSQYLKQCNHLEFKCDSTKCKLSQ